MINPASLAAVEAGRFGEHFVRPRYDDYGFAQIPQTVRCVLTGEGRGGVPWGPRCDLDQRYDAVILFFVDALGWRFFQAYAEEHPFLRRAVEQGVVSKLTSQFPSTTAAHVTAIHTGRPIGQSGIYEWFFYEPLVDAMIAPLLFSYAGDGERESLARSGVLPVQIFPSHTLYQELANHGVRSWVFQHQAYSGSSYTRAVTSGATVVPFRTLPEGLVDLQRLLEDQQQPSYYFLYYDAIDAICHMHGPESPQTEAEILTFLDMMERLLVPALARQSRRVLFLMTADHGQTAIDPATTIYLNRTLPALVPMLKTNRAGQLLVPAGAARDFFLHIKDGMLAEAQGLLERHLEGKAEIHRVSDLIEQGFFGPPPLSSAFLARVANLVVLPYRQHSVWWWEPPRFEQQFYGHHGGLTVDEMETLLLAQA
jgi:hypothetical protein